MIYIYASIALSIWLSFAGFIHVLRPRLKYLVITFPLVIALLIGTFASVIDYHLGYETSYFFHAFSFYKFLFMKNWAYSVLMICGSLTCYELAKFTARKYRVKNPKSPVTTVEYFQDLP